MTTVIGLLLMLLTVSEGVVTHCDGRRNGTQCYGALGGSVSIQLMDDFFEIPKYTLYKNTNVVLLGRKGQHNETKISNISSFIPSNGTFWINNLSRSDSDTYTLKTYDAYGKYAATHTLQLLIQAPVSPVSLVSECLSQGEMKVSCSSEGGDSPQYRWTLNGKSLTEAELLSGNEQTNIITLKQHVSGRLVCSVWNNVSSAAKDINIHTCGFIYIDCTFNGTKISKWVFKENNTLCVEPTTVSPKETQSTVGKESGSLTTSPFNTTYDQTVNPGKEEPWYISMFLPILAGVLSALLIFLLVGIAVICTRKKKPIAKAATGEHELIYADVRVVKQQSKKQTLRPCEDAVEYGQVNFRERPQRSDMTADECVYAKVQKNR